MKQDLHCDIVKDLLPSYTDGICSETSKLAVQHHLEGCANCKECLKMIQTNENMADIQEEMDSQQTDKRILKKIKSKIRKRAIIGSLVLAPLMFLWFWGFYLNWLQPMETYPLSMEYMAKFQEEFIERYPECEENGWNFVPTQSFGRYGGSLYIDDFYIETKSPFLVEGSLFPKMQLGNPSDNSHPLTFRILDWDGNIVVGETTVPVGEVSFSMKQLKKETPYILQIRDFPEEGVNSFTFQ